ncbi:MULTISPECIES: alpha/beta fold hydrolase [Paraburkholderia]|uniref:Alpha/beta hydrolase n=1 Tax=Paraburkholderia metrosideri TaxID=580937 RepID=A0ABW9E4J9_9BURK
MVHGGRHGGWCWKHVASRLREAGHEVFTPTATGLGERSHLLAPTIGLQTHIQDIVGVLEWEDLQDVVLVGHSYGGMLITGAADKVPHRVAHLVYLDALLPRNGDCCMSLIGPENARMFQSACEKQGEGWYVPVTAGYAAFNGVIDEADSAWLESKVTPQSIATYHDPIESTDAAWKLPGTYIECLKSVTVQPLVLTRARDRARVDATFRYRELNTGHGAMFTDPDGVTTLLLEALSDPQ